MVDFTFKELFLIYYHMNNLKEKLEQNCTDEIPPNKRPTELVETLKQLLNKIESVEIKQ